MDQKIRILVLLSLLVLGGAFLFFYRIADLDVKPLMQTSFLMRNLTWQTDFGMDIPFKK